MFSIDSASGDITGRGTLSAYIDIKKTSSISVEHTAGKLLNRHVFLEPKTALNDLFLSNSAFSILHYYCLLTPLMSPNNTKRNLIDWLSEQYLLPLALHASDFFRMKH